MTTRRRDFLIGAGAAAAMSGRALAQVPGSAFAQQLTIGVNVTLTGDRAVFGEQIVRGVQAAVDERNRTSPSLTLVYAVRQFDDQNGDALAVSNAQVAASDPNIVAMVGNLTPEITLAALPFYANLGMPLIVPGITADSLTARGYRNIYRLPTKDSVQGQLFARSIRNRKIVSANAVAVALDGAYGYDLASGFTRARKADGGHADLLLAPADGPDFAGLARRIAGSGVDYVFLAGTSAALGSLVTALAQAGYTGAFGAGDGFYNQTTLTTYASPLRNALVATPMPPLERVAGNTVALADFGSHFGPVTSLSAFAYAATQIIIAAAQITPGVSPRLSTLQSLSRHATFQTLVGPFSFDFAGDPIDPNIYLYRVDGDHFTYDGAAHATAAIF